MDLLLFRPLRFWHVAVCVNVFVHVDGKLCQVTLSNSCIVNKHRYETTLGRCKIFQDHQSVDGLLSIFYLSILIIDLLYIFRDIAQYLSFT